MATENATQDWGTTSVPLSGNLTLTKHQFPKKDHGNDKQKHESRPASVDVLLIHGLTGDATTTWGTWPRDLAEDPTVDATVWTLGYPFPLLDGKLGTVPESFSDEGRRTLTPMNPLVTASTQGLARRSMPSCINARWTMDCWRASRRRSLKALSRK